MPKRARKKLTEKEAKKLGGKSLYRLKPEEKQALVDHWEAKFRRMHMGEYHAEDTHWVTRMDPWDLRDLATSLEDEWAENEAVERADYVQEDIIREAMKPAPYGGGRRVGFERFKGINSMVGFSKG